MTEALLTVALKQIEKLLIRARRGEVNWTTAPVPKPDAMRAFEGQCPGFHVIVTQFNLEGAGVRCDGAMVDHTGSGVNVIHLTPEAANELYHLAQASRG